MASISNPLFRKTKMYSNKIIQANKNLQSLPPYIFGRIKKLKDKIRKKKIDVIDLDMGNPDQPTFPHIVERLIDTVKNHPGAHRYPQAKGMPKLRKTIAQWYQKKYGKKIDPESQVLVLIGSKEGICHLLMSYLNPGDIALVLDPTYPVHFNGVYLAGGVPYSMPLKEENNYLPDLEVIPKKILSAKGGSSSGGKKAKIIISSYPNNPTTATLPNKTFFKKLVVFAKKYNLIAVHDFAYVDVVFDGYQPPSFLTVPGAMDIGVEFYSFSKTYNMAGWRLGFVIGNQEIIANLEKFKSFVDYGVFTAIQLAGVSALEESEDNVKKMQEIYAKRRNFMVENLNKIGWLVKKPKATMYLWIKIPEKFCKKMNSLEFSEYLLKETGVAVAPGSGFGRYGEGYIRMSLVTNDERYSHVIKRLKKISK